MYLFSQPLQLVSLIIILISLVVLWVAHNLMRQQSEKRFKQFIYTLDEISMSEPCDVPEKTVGHEYY